MKVHIPNPLQSYTKNIKAVESFGSTIEEVLNNLEIQFPGIKFRMINEQDEIRKHIRIFINQNLIDTLDVPVLDNDEIHIITALSGG